MPNVFQAIPIAEKVYWVGAIDWAVRDFHGYLTRRGTTYNAYLVLAEKVTLIDTVKAPLYGEMMARIASVIDPRAIDVIVSNHAEPDHSGALARTAEATRPQAVYASAKGAETLARQYPAGCAVTVVADGQTLDLGDRKLTCAETRMCHWPDSMVSYLHEAQLLFSQDAFGMHLASHERFADELPDEVIGQELAKYFANILMPLAGPITKALDKLRSLNLPIRIIAPDHGPIWRTDPMAVVETYARWCAQPRLNKAVVVYDTMWGATETMARAIAEGLAGAGTPTRVHSLRSAHRSDLASELLDAGALVVGGPTINNELFPSLHDAMSYLRGLRPKGLVGAAFGSYGWSGEGPRHLRDILQQMKVEFVEDEPLRCKYTPDDEMLAQCRALGAKISARLAEKHPD